VIKQNGRMWRVNCTSCHEHLGIVNLRRFARNVDLACKKCGKLNDVTSILWPTTQRKVAKQARQLSLFEESQIESRRNHRNVR
jgi:NAD-dependent SIR2 family protein deacetylase